MTPSPQALYRLYDAAGVLLYVGVSLNVAQRMGQHRADKPWWQDVARIEIESHPTRTDVLRAEQVAIRTERPRHNVALVPRPVVAVVGSPDADERARRKARARADGLAVVAAATAARKAAEAEVVDARREERQIVLESLDSGLRPTDVVRITGYSRETVRRHADAARRERTSKAG